MIVINNRERYIFFLLVVLIAIFFQDILFFGKSFWLRDIVRYHYPNRFLAQEMVLQGIFPLWNPYQFCGLPLFAQVQNGILQPLGILHYLFPFWYGFKLLILLQFMIGGWFTYLMLRAMHFRTAASTAGTLVFVFCGPTLSLINNFPMLQSVVWLPLVYIFLTRALAGRSSWPFLLLAVVIVIQLLSGQPEVILCDLLIIVLVTSFHLIAMSTQERKFFFWHTGMMSIAIISLAAIQYIPFAEYVAVSDRSQGLFNKYALSFSLHPWELITTVVPSFRQIWGQLNLVKLQGYTGTAYFRNLNYGILTILLWIYSCWKWRDRRFQVFLILALASLVLMFGKYSFVYRFLFDFVPGFNLFRSPVKFIFLGTFCAAILAAFGFQSFFDQLERKSARFLLGLAISTGLIVFSGYLILFWQAPEITASFIAKILQVTGQKTAGRHFQEWSGYLFKNMQFILLFSSIIIVAVIALGVFYRRRIFNQALASKLFIILLLINLWLPSFNKEAMVDDEEMKNFKVPLTTYLRQDRTLFRVYNTPELTTAVEQQSSDNLANLLEVYKQTLLKNIGQLSHIYYPDAYEALGPDYAVKLDILLQTQPNLSATPILPMLNVKYAISDRPVSDPAYVFAAKAGLLYIYKSRYFLSRATIMPEILIVPNEQAFYRQFTTGFNVTRQILLEETAEQETTGVSGQANILDYSPHKVSIETEVKGEKAWLLLADMYYPGWQATLDGLAVKIYKADYMLRAVSVPGGKHTIQFLYQPRSFSVGLFASLLALFVISLRLVCTLRGVKNE